MTKWSRRGLTKPLHFLPNPSSINLDQLLQSCTIHNMGTSMIPIKSRLEKGNILYGQFLCSFSPIIAEISGYAGVVVDMEHGYGGISSALPCLQAVAATGTPAILRLPECSHTWAEKALDLGPQGIMFPMIDTPELARQAVSYYRYPPNGVRGAAHPIVLASRYGIDEEYLAKCESELLIMCQVESAEGLRKVSEIAAVDGVDCIQIGPLDLRASLGQLGDPLNEKLRAMLNQAEEAVIGLRKRIHGPYLAGFAMPNDRPEELRARGYHMVSGCVDIGIYRAAVVYVLRSLKRANETGRSTTNLSVIVFIIWWTITLVNRKLPKED